MIEKEVVVETEFQAEVADEVEDEDEVDDQTEALLKGFESDGDDEDPENGEEYVASEAPKPKLTKSQKKKIQTALADAESQKPGVIYIGRIPHGFYEHEMREYFKQFGTILQLRLSRNRKTGQSKHFAFVQFESGEVAGIVSKTMDNYLMFGHLLKVKVIPNDQLSPDTFKGANKRFKKVPWNKIEGRKLKAGATEKVWDDRVVREEEKRTKKAAKLLEIGYEFEAPKLKSAKGLAQEHVEPPAVIETEVEVEVVKEDVVDIKETPVVEPATKSKKKSNKRKAPEEAAIVDDAIIANAGKEASKPKKNKKAKITESKAIKVDEITPVVETPVEAPAVEESKPKKKAKKSKTVLTSEVVVEEEDDAPPEEESAKPKKAKKSKIVETAEVVEEAPATESSAKPKKVKGKKAMAAVEEAVVPEEKVKKTKKGRKSV